MLHNGSVGPDWSSAPGSTILDILDAREISIEQLAAGVGFTVPQTQRLIDGSLELNNVTAQRLSAAIGGSTEFWLARENDYRACVDSTRQEAALSAERLLSELPFRDMISFGWIPPSTSKQEKIEECLEFFAVSSFAQWERRYGGMVQSAAFHKSEAFTASQAATTAWLRQGEIQTSDDRVTEWSPKNLEAQISTFKRLTWFKSPDLFLPKIRSALASCGVKFAVVRSPKGCRASGAVRLLDNGTPLIQMSFRYLSDDQFWFSLFHEIGHLVLHYDKLPIIEESNMEQNAFEQEANAYASNTIVPVDYKEELYSLGASKNTIIAFAKKMGIAPGLIVGQLQHHRIIGFKQMPYLKRRYRWT